MPPQARGTPDYEASRSRLPPGRQQVLAFVEESILTDLVRTHGRRALNDGTIADFTALDEFGLMVTFQAGPDGKVQFVDFLFVDD